MTSNAANQEAETPKWRLEYRVFRGTWASWEELFRRATEFANEVGPEKVVSISHSEDQDDGVVAVWYWTNEDDTAWRLSDINVPRAHQRHLNPSFHRSACQLNDLTEPGPILRGLGLLRFEVMTD